MKKDMIHSGELPNRVHLHINHSGLDIWLVRINSHIEIWRGIK